jgi:nicotinamide mononucleotide (NMN) deamidase PncC
MSPAEAVAAIRDQTQARVFVACSGGGAGLPKLICDVPGISSFFEGAAVPYSAAQFEAFLGFVPEKFCSPEAAVDLAMQAYLHAWAPGRPAVGVGLTAVVATLQPHRGPHRVYVAALSDGGCRLHSLELTKGSGLAQRESDGRDCDLLGLNALLEAAGCPPLSLGLAASSEDAGLLARERLLRRPFFAADGRRLEEPPALPPALFPGAFDPPHFGHLAMARTFEAAVGNRPVFHVTLDPPHKPALGTAQILQRAKLLAGHDRFFSLGDPLYLDKARRWPGARILMGLDALERMLDPRWCPVEPMMAEFAALGTRFYVVARGVDEASPWLDKLGMPPRWRALFTPLPGHYDVSSTRVREEKSESSLD